MALATIGIAVVVLLIILIPIIVLAIIAEWKLFEKCGEKGWKAIIPYYNDWTLVEISGCHWWYFLFIIGSSFFSVSVEVTEINGTIMAFSSILSLVALYVNFCINYNIAKKFHQGMWFAVGMTFLPFVFYLILGLSSRYQFDASVPVSAWGIYDFEKKQSDLNVSKSYCSECGSEITGNFCPKCGNKKGD